MFVETYRQENGGSIMAGGDARRIPYPENFAGGLARVDSVSPGSVSQHRPGSRYRGEGRIAACYLWHPLYSDRGSPKGGPAIRQRRSVAQTRS